MMNSTGRFGNMTRFLPVIIFLATISIAEGKGSIVPAVSEETTVTSNPNVARTGDCFGSSYQMALTQTNTFLAAMWREYGPTYKDEKRWEQDLRAAVSAARAGHWQSAQSNCNLVLLENPRAHDAWMLRAIADRRINQLKLKTLRKLKFPN